MISKIVYPNPKWQLVVPKSVREELKIDDPRMISFTFEVKGMNSVELTPTRRRSWKDFAGKYSARKLGIKSLSVKAIDEAIGKAVVKDLEGEL